MIHKLSRFLMMLVALFAMTTGAWAEDTETIVTTGYSGNNVTINGTNFKIVCDLCDNSQEKYKNGFILGQYSYNGPYNNSTISLINPSSSVKATKIKIYTDGDDYVKFAKIDNGDVTYSGSDYSASKDVSLSGDGTVGLTFNKSSAYACIIKVEITYEPLTVSGPTIVEGKPQWTFAMPAGNVELQVAYYPGMLTLAQAENGSIVLYLEGDALPAGFEKDDDGNIYVADKTEFKVKATPADGFRLASLMFGETDITDQVDADGKATVTMPEGNADITLTAQFSDEYDIAFQPANTNTIQSGKATVKVGTEQKTLDEEGKLKQVQMGQTVTIEATTGYKFRKVEAKNGITPATALSPALVNGATVVFTFNYKGSITTFTCTNNNGSFTCVAAGHNANELPGSLTLEENNTKLRFDTACTKSFGTIRDMEQTVIEFNIAESTYYFMTKGGGLSSFTVSVNGTDVTDQLTELK